MSIFCVHCSQSLFYFILQESHSQAGSAMFCEGISIFCVLYVLCFMMVLLCFVFCISMFCTLYFVDIIFFLFCLLCVLSIDIIYLVFFFYVSTVHCTSTLTFLNLFVCPSIHTCGQRPCCNCTWPSSLQLHLPGQIQNKYISRFKTNASHPLHLAWEFDTKVK